MSCIEERISSLEDKVAELNGIIDTLLSGRNEKWETPAQVAELLHCSVNNIYVKIRKGEIFADRSTGRPRIPMSQFKQPVGPPVEKKVQHTQGNENLRKLIFGKDGNL